MRITRHWIATGRVQGVGYRQFIYRSALELGCTGWVRNRADGTVEAVVQGPAPAVEKLLVNARLGPRGAKVDEITAAAAAGEYTQFEICPTA